MQPDKWPRAHQHHRKQKPVTIEPLWTCVQRRLHARCVQLISLSIALIPLGDAIVAYTTGRTFDSHFVTAAMALLAIANGAAHIYANKGVEYSDR